MGASRGGSDFDLTLDHYVAFVPARKVKIEKQNSEADGEDSDGDEGGNEASVAKPLQANIASLVPVQKWTTDLTEIVWSVKWNLNGLIPVRPLVVLSSAGSLKPGESIAI